MRSKKAVEMSITTIVIAAICLLILVILAVLVARSSGDLSEGTKCITKGGICKLSCDEPGQRIGTGPPLCDSGYSCCRPI